MRGSHRGRQALCMEARIPIRRGYSVTDARFYPQVGVQALLVFRESRYYWCVFVWSGTCVDLLSLFSIVPDCSCALILMRLRLATLLLSSLFPCLGMAQALPSLVTPTANAPTPLVEQLLALDASGQSLPAGSTPVLPIWSGSNGHLLAVVALPPAWVNALVDPTPGYAGPSTWRLAGTTLAGAGGLRWQTNSGLHTDLMLGQYLDLAAMPAACDANGCDAAAPRWSPTTLTGLLGMGWSSADDSLDVSYGLSWLHAQDGFAAPGNSMFGTVLVPMLASPDALHYSLDSETSLYARGRWRFEQGPALDVAASYGRGHLSALGSPLAGVTSINAAAPGIDLDQLSLSLGLDAGSLRGAIVGHVLSSDDPAFANKRWTTLDLGVSWRTPWRGELSIGAQNLWSAPTNTVRDTDSSQVRTPYIQYRQDL